MTVVAPEPIHRYYFRLSELAEVDIADWRSMLPARDWSDAEKDRLKRGLFEMTNSDKYSSLKDKYYYISQYIMDGTFSPTEVGSAIFALAVSHPDWVCICVNSCPMFVV